MPASKKEAVHSFDTVRSFLQQLLYEGCATGGDRTRQRYLEFLREMVFRDEIKVNGRQYQIVLDPYAMPENFLRRAYQLCAPPSKKNGALHLLVLQCMADGAPRGRGAVSDSIPGNVDGKTTARVLEMLTAQGVLRTRQTARGATWQLAPDLPEELRSGPMLGQLRQLEFLIPLLADRRPPQTWGYRARDTLRRLLRQNGAEPYGETVRGRVQKRASRVQLLLEDEILWQLSDAFARGAAVRLEFDVPAAGRRVKSGFLQPLQVMTDQTEGRSYLVARPLAADSVQAVDAAPCVLPLEYIHAVWQRRFYPKPAQSDKDYRDAWLGDSRTGLSPAAAQNDGEPAPPTTVKIFFERPLSLDTETWKRRLPKYGGELKTEGDLAIFAASVTRPEDLAWLLLRMDDCITAVDSGEHPFAAQWMARRRQWHTLGVAPPHSPVPFCPPLCSEEGEEANDTAQPPLFDPTQNADVQEALARLDDALLGEKTCVIRRRKWETGPCWTMLEEICETSEKKDEYTPLEAAPVPARLSWPEMDWLLWFLHDPLAGALLDGPFCRKLGAWLENELAEAQAQGAYCRHFETGFWQNKNALRPATAQREVMLPVLDALCNDRWLAFVNRTRDGADRESRGIPTRLEYVPTTGGLFLMVYLESEQRQIRINCASLQSAQALPDAVSPRQRTDADGWLDQSRRERVCTAGILLWRDAAYLHRACGVLRPYLCGVERTVDGQPLLRLRYFDFERANVVNDLAVLMPGLCVAKDSADPEEKERAALVEALEKKFPLRKAEC